MNEKQPILKGRFWHMPDGGIVPNIYGGKPDETPEEAVERLKGELKTANNEAAGFRTSLRKLEKSTEGFDPEVFKQMQADLAASSQKDSEAKGNYDQALADYKETHDKALVAANATSEGWKGRFEKLAVDNQMLAAATNAVDPKGAMTLLRSEYDFKVAEDGTVEIMKGKDVVFDDKGKPVQPAALMETFLTEKPYLVKASDKKGGNSQQNSRDKGDGEKSTQDKVADGLNELLTK